MKNYLFNRDANGHPSESSFELNRESGQVKYGNISLKIRPMEDPEVDPEIGSTPGVVIEIQIDESESGG